MGGSSLNQKIIPMMNDQILQNHWNKMGIKGAGFDLRLPAHTRRILFSNSHAHFQSFACRS